MTEGFSGGKGTFIVESADETRFLGGLIGERLEGGETILMMGPLGSGKTTMVQGIAVGLGIRERVKSPSFILERIYEGRLTLHHFDFYRLKEEEIVDSGLLCDLEDVSVTVIEWPQRAGALLSGWSLRIGMQFHHVRIGGSEIESLDRRKITVESAGSRWERIIENIWEDPYQKGKGFGCRNKH